MYDNGGALLDATGVQTAYVLDSLYAAKASTRTYGVTFGGAAPAYRLWAPTAQQVSASPGRRPRPTDAPVSQAARTPMERAADGSWSAAAGVRNARYLYEVTVCAPTTGKVETSLVTDPYSVALTLNSTRSVAVDLRDRAFQPALWRQTATARPEAGRRLDDLRAARAGLLGRRRHGQRREPRLVPRVRRERRRHQAPQGARRRRAQHRAPAADLRHRLDRGGPGEAGDARRATCLVRPGQRPAAGLRRRGRGQGRASTGATTPGTTWRRRGRTPPRPPRPTAAPGSPSSAPWSARCTRTGCASCSTRSSTTRRPPARTRQVGARQDRPRLLPAAQRDGRGRDVDLLPERRHRARRWRRSSWWTRSCCGPATTRSTGSASTSWATTRRANMLAVRAALDELTLAKDGVDGKSVYLYGEGWNFGEVANNARFVQATQGQLGGTGIGTFSDRLRDAVRGGGPFDEDPRKQGFGSGEATDPNGAADQAPAAAASAPARHRPGPARPGRQPALVRLPQQRVRRGQARRRGRVQRRPGGLRGPARRGHQLRRRARQRDAVRQPDLQAAGRHHDAGPRPDELPVARDHCPVAVAVVLARGRRPAAQQVAGPQQLRQR